MTPDEGTIARYWREFWTEGRLEVAHEVYAPRFRQNSDELTRDAFIEGAAAWRAHFTDFRADVDELFSVGSRVISRVTYRGTHTGDFKRVPATGRPFELTGIDIFEFEAGEVTRHWHETDHLELFLQLGAQLAPAAESPEEGR